MRTLLFLQTNSIASKETIEYIMALAKDLNANLKFAHIHYPDILYTASLATNMELFQTPNEQHNYTALEIERTEAYMQQLKKEGKVDKEVNFEYFTGVPEVILKSKLINGEFDMLAIQNDSRVNSINPYQPLKNIIKNINCPIWVIPESEYKGVESPLYTTDYQEEDVKCTELLLDMLPQLRQITFIHLTDHLDFLQKIKVAGFRTYVRQKTSFLNIDSLAIPTHEKRSIPEYIQEALTEKGGSFIVALKENKNLFQQVFYRSFTTKLLKGLNELILIMHAQDFMDGEEKNQEEL